MPGFHILSGRDSPMAGFLKQLFGGKDSRKSEIEKALHQIEDGRPEMRRSAALRLGKFGDKSEAITAALTKLKLDPVTEVRHAADWALRKIGGG